MLTSDASTEPDEEELLERDTQVRKATETYAEGGEEDTDGSGEDAGEEHCQEKQEAKLLGLHTIDA